MTISFLKLHNYYYISHRVKFFQIILHRIETKIKILKHTYTHRVHKFLLYALRIHSFVLNLNVFCYQEAE